MKTACAVMVLVGGLTATFAQDVFVLGGPGSTPVPPVVYQPPVVTGQPPIAYQPAIVYQPVVAAVPVVPVYGAAVPCAPNYYNGYYNQGGYYNPNVLYVGGPGSCGPEYYRYSQCAPNVIYFGRGQAYRQGYSFGSCR